MFKRLVLRDNAARQWLVFSAPADMLVARDVAEVVPVLDEAAARVSRDRAHVAGFLCYEAAAAFDSAYVTHRPGPLPLACFGVFEAPEPARDLPAPGVGSMDFPRWLVDIERGDYRDTIAAIRREIALGNTYQVNYCVRQHAEGIRDAWTLFRNIAMDAPYAAYLEGADYAIVSASPELFFELSGDRLTCKPMKGTAARGMTTTEDNRIRDSLVHSIKNRAENVMIADMVRNDLGRIATPGSVQATSLFDVEKYRTVWQMTSTVTARTDASITEIFRALFPSASITGAPKVASMRLIAGLERSPRQVYTGCVGFIGPDRRARFNVAIRTAVIDRRDGSAVYGVGGGIVWDSKADDEYQECLDKATILESGIDDRRFSLLETLLWTRAGGCHLLGRHLARLADSAEYFDFPCDLVRIRKQLDRFVEALSPSPQRIRLLLDNGGASMLEAQALEEQSPASPLRLRIARRPVDRRDPFLYHKTTRRDAYEEALAAAGGGDDVLLWNDSGEITESSIANVVARIGTRLYTPPVACGLLAGTLRASLLADGKLAERVIRLDELPDLDEIYLINSVRGWRSASIDEAGAPAR